MFPCIDTPCVDEYNMGCFDPVLTLVQPQNGKKYIQLPYVLTVFWSSEKVFAVLKDQKIVLERSAPQNDFVSIEHKIKMR